MEVQCFGPLYSIWEVMVSVLVSVLYSTLNLYIADTYIFPILKLTPSGMVAYSNPACLEIKAGGA